MRIKKKTNVKKITEQTSKKNNFHPKRVAIAITTKRYTLKITKLRKKHILTTRKKLFCLFKNKKLLNKQNKIERENQLYFGRNKKKNHGDKHQICK